MKRLAIVGSHPDTRENAPFDDPDVDIWVFNEAAMAAWCRRWDAVFQIHTPEVYTSPNNTSNKGHWAWLQEAHGERVIWMGEQDERVPNSRKYPLDEIIEKVPGAHLRWFDSSPSYAMALAIYQGYEEITLYGMDLVSNTEYVHQLRNWNFWVGVAMGRGIRIVFESEPNDFGNGRLYGYEGEVQIERAAFWQRVDTLEKAWEQAERDLSGLKEQVQEVIRQRKSESVAEVVKDYQARVLAAGEVSGGLAEAQNYAAREDPISRQEFEQRCGVAQREGEALRAQMYHAGGQFEYVYNVWQQTGNPQALEQAWHYLGIEMQRAYDCGAMMGAYRENLQYMFDFDERVTAAGGQKTLEALWRTS